MCLYKCRYLPNISQHDLIVYKFLIIKDQEFYTPYMCSKITPDSIQIGKIARPFKFIIDLLCSKTISQGFVHTFRNIEQAKKEAHSVGYCFHPYKVVIYECVIPKYTFYYYGGNEDIAARKIKYIKQIEL